MSAEDWSDSAKSALALSTGTADGFMNRATAPVMDWERDVGGVLMMLLRPPAVEPWVEEIEDEEEEVDGEDLILGADAGGGAGLEAEFVGI